MVTEVRNNLQDIVDQLALDPTLYLDEVAAYIKEKYALDISLSTISRCLKAKGISKKVLQKQALERNQELRDY
ncbi:MAG: hypothetical protein M1813_002788 [Trichoglossum hirsutum]|nr:MAG: hypothetical protein M1813_002788 [Trichoglossum hirsutum]